LVGAALSLDRWHHFVTEIGSLLGAPIEQPVQWDHGEAGTTIVQPIGRGYAALEIWREHRGAYLFIASWRPLGLFPGRIAMKAAEFGLSCQTAAAPITASLR
jgi:hypothetical protein